MIDDFGDHLGELYMEVAGDQKSSGQYFTPYQVSRLISEITFAQKPPENKVTTLNELTCGSGGIVVAVAQTLDRLRFNYANNMLIVANDIDRNCVLMSYLQIAYTGMPAVIKHQDTLSQKSWDTFTTPAFLLQNKKFKQVYESLFKNTEM